MAVEARDTVMWAEVRARGGPCHSPPFVFLTCPSVPACLSLVVPEAWPGHHCRQEKPPPSRQPLVGSLINNEESAFPCLDVETERTWFQHVWLADWTSRLDIPTFLKKWTWKWSSGNGNAGAGMTCSVTITLIYDTRVKHPESDADLGWCCGSGSRWLPAQAPARPPVATGSEGLSPCVGDSALPLFSEDKLDVTCLTLGEIGYSGKNANRLQKKFQLIWKLPYQKRCIFGPWQELLPSLWKNIIFKVVETCLPHGPLELCW